MEVTNLKISPYFDDFDRSKNYQKVLFKPGYSVQTRELNTLQSILQNQVERFGSHVFKEGSVVVPGNMDYNVSYKAVMVQSLINGISVEKTRTSLVGKELTGVSSGVKAEVLNTISSETSDKDTITLYVKYTAGGITENNLQIKEFKNNEVLQDSSGLALAVTTVQNATAYTGSSATINAGIYFIRGYFIEVAKQTIILDQYGNKPSYKIGLKVTETIATVSDDNTLYDNALGSTNYAAPGSDRLKITATLTKQNLLLTDDANFIELLRLEDGEPKVLVDNSTYNELEKNLARRTFDESGHYITSPYTVKIREALDDGQNGGLYTSGTKLADGTTIVDSVNDSSPSTYIDGKQYYAVELGEGKSYVKGFEISSDRKQYKLVPKPRKTNSVENKGVVIDVGSYFKLDTSDTQLIKGGLLFNGNLSLKNVAGTIIGDATAIGFIDGSKAFVSNVTIFRTIVLSGDPSTNSITVGDRITGSISAATAYVHSISGNTLTIRQVSADFITGEAITGSRFNSITALTVSSYTKNLLENVRTVETSGNNNFSGSIAQDPVTLSGSSFVVSGQTLTGINSRFTSELTVDSELRIGNSTVEVDAIASDTSLTFTGSITATTYYNISKTICKLYQGKSGLTTKIFTNPIKNGSSFAFNKLNSRIGEFTTSGQQIVIQAPSNEVIDKNTLALTKSDRIITTYDTSLSSSGNILTVTNIKDPASGGNISDNTSINVYYKSRVTAATNRTKTKRTYQLLLVDKAFNSTNTVYGTRFSDKEISLKFSDAAKIHAIHEAIGTDDDIEVLFDSLTLNNSTPIKSGDIITSGLIKARVITKSTTANKVFVKYLSSMKFQSGTNLAISVKVPTNINASGTFVRGSQYGRYKDVTNDFTFVKNDTSEFYRISKLVRKSSSAVPTSKLVVVYDFFEHSNVTNDFYTVESYGTLTYENIPLSYDYNSLADIVDFRYHVQGSSTSGAGGSGTVSSPYVENAGSSPLLYSNNTLTTTTKVPYPNTVFSLNYDFYLGRIDKVYLTTSGEIRVIQGSDAIEPQTTDDTSAGLLIATIKLPAYLKNVLDATIDIENNRNYTMHDIGKLEKRLANVEKYSSLSLLETNTNNLNILDEEGRNRFKNGFLVDSFITTDVADLSNPDYTASIDLDKNVVRPYPYVNNVGFNFNSSSSTATKSGNYITAPYTELSYISQPYSSRVENVTPFEVFSYVGDLDISPKKDIWYDTVREIREGQNINLVDSFRFLFDRVVPGGEEWGSWNEIDQFRGGGGTTTVEARTGTAFGVNDLNFDIETGDTINQVQDIKFSRSRVIDVKAESLKPSTTFYFHVNDSSSSNIIYPKLLTGLTNTVGRFVVGESVLIQPLHDDGVVRAAVVEGIRATVQNPTSYLATISQSDFVTDNTVIANNGYTSSTSILAIDDVRSLDGSDINPGDIGTKFRILGESSGATTDSNSQQVLKSNELGTLETFVLLPQDTFETGNLTFSFSDDPNDVKITGLTGSFASGVYYSQGTTLNVSSSIISVDVPEITSRSIRDERRIFVADPPPPRRGGDPLAQSFFIEEDGGVMVTSIDIYFYSKDTSIPINLEIRTVQSGLPTDTIVPGSRVTVQAASVNTSTDGTKSTKFSFNRPVYLTDKNDYVFVLKTTSNKYNVWVSRLGESDVGTGFIIDKQPALGVLFKSANNKTWISDQYEDIKFVLNRAQFTTNTAYTAVLDNKPIPACMLPNNPFSFQKGSSTVKVFQPNHGMHSIGNKVLFSNVASDTPNGTLTANIATTDMSLTIKDVTGFAFTSTSIPSGWQKTNNADVSTSNPGYLKIDNEIISYSAISSSGTVTIISRGALTTAASVHVQDAVIECYNLNGVRLDQINTTQTVTGVTSLDEYEIVVTDNATNTLKSGGSSSMATRNISYEIIHPKINSFIPEGTESNITYTSRSGTSIGNSLQTSFIARGSETLENGVENILNEPKIVLSDPNVTQFASGVSGTLSTNVVVSTTNNRLSPIIDLEGSSVVTISNRLNKELVSGSTAIDVSSELTPTGGKHSSYITKKVALENRSTSVKVLFDAIRNSSNDIKVFAKTKNDSDPGNFEDMNYIEIPSISYPASSTKSEYKAFDYELKDMGEFQEFSVKIVMIGDDQSDVPKIRNVRCLALAI